MKIIGGLIELKAEKWKVYLPFFIRTGLNLQKTTPLYMQRLKPEKGIERTEVIASTFKPNLWGHLWMIQLAMTERKGLVNEVVTFLRRKLGSHLLSEESLTTEQDQTHELSLVFDLLKYRTPYDASSRERKESLRWDLPELRLDILKRFMKDIKRTRYNEPRLSISRMGFLHQASTRITRGRDAHATKVDNHHRVAIPRKIVQTIQRELRKRGEVTFSKERKVVVFSDTEEKYLSFYFPHPNDRVFWLQIPSKETGIDTVTAITRFFKKDNWNILGSYTTLCKSRNVKYKVDLVVETKKKRLSEKKLLLHIQNNIKNKARMVLPKEIKVKWYDSTKARGPEERTIDEYIAEKGASTPARNRAISNLGRKGRIATFWR